MRYSSKDKLKSGVPLGGIGAGKLEILPNGTLDFFTIANNFDNPITDNPHPDRQIRATAEGVAGFNFALSCLHKKTRTTTLLQTVRFADYPVVDRIDYEGLFPFARLNYQKPNLPCKISLEAFSPFIPKDSKNSAIPCAIFEFTIKNPNSEKIEASLLACAKNIVGNWSVGKYNRPLNDPRIFGLLFGKNKALVSDFTNGELLVAIPRLCGRISWFPQFNLQKECFKFSRGDKKLDFWDDFSKTGMLSGRNGCKEAESENMQPAGALCCTTDIGAYSSKTIRIIYSWYFPHAERSHIYQRSFKNALSVASHVNRNFAGLKKRSLAWHDRINKIDMPAWLKDAAINNLYPYFSSGWWDKKGNFSISEAPCEIALMGTLDVRYYDSVARAILFPDLEKNELMHFAKAQRPSGYIPHDLGKARVDSPSNGTTFYLWRDLSPKFILMAYRNFLWHKDTAQIKKLYPHIKKAFKWTLSTDRNKDFLPDNAGLDQTFDVWEFHGTNSYTSSIYLASLLALEKIAQSIGDKKLSLECRAIFRKASENFQAQLWNGRYFIACNGPKGKDTACTLGQINGQWYAHLLGLGYIVDKQKVKKAIKSIFSLNAKDTMLGATNSVLPDGRRDYSSLQSKNLWAGEIYAFSALCIYEGFSKQGIEISRRMWDNISRKQLSPWDQPDMFDPDTGRFLFGDHYMRNISVWALVQAYKPKIF